MLDASIFSFSQSVSFFFRVGKIQDYVGESKNHMAKKVNTDHQYFIFFHILSQTKSVISCCLQIDQSGLKGVIW